MYTFRQPGVYAYLNHNLIEAVELGALSHVVVEGEWDDNLPRRQVKKATQNALMRAYPLYAYTH